MKRSEYLFLTLVLLLGFSWRFLFLEATNAVIDGDEAIVGLMALHILEGASWPIFYYGQNYMGSFEAILTAAAFSFIGSSSLALKTVPLVFSLYLIAAVYIFTREISSIWAARVASLLTAISPSALTVWSTKARGGFIEIVALGTIALYLAYLLLARENDRMRNALLLGLVVGLGWWINNQMIYYAVAIAAVFIFLAPFLIGFVTSIRVAAVGAVSFLIGGLPFWYANLILEPRFATFNELLGRTSPVGSSFADHVWGFINNSLPILVGAARFWSDKETFLGSKLLFGGLYLIFVSIFLLASFRASAKEKRRESTIVGLLFSSFFFSVLVIFSASSFGWLSQAPRYLLPLYSILYVVVGISLYWLRENFQGGKLLSYALLALLLLAQGHSNFYQGRWYRPGEPVIFEDDRVSKDHAELYQWLSERKIKHIHTNYWIGYRVAFETKEKVKFTRFGEPKDLRIPKYEIENQQEPLADRVYVMGPKEATVLQGQLQEMGYLYALESASSYQIIYNIRPIHLQTEGKEIPLDPSMFTTTHKADVVANLFDNDTSTRWGSGTPQSPGMTISVELRRPTIVTHLMLDYGNFSHDMPRGLAIFGKLENSEWKELFRFKKGEFLTRELKLSDGKASNAIELYLQPTRLVGIRFEQFGRHPIVDWSIAELKIYSVEE